MKLLDSWARSLRAAGQSLATIGAYLIDTRMFSEWFPMDITTAGWSPIIERTFATYPRHVTYTRFLTVPEAVGNVATSTIAWLIVRERRERATGQVTKVTMKMSTALSGAHQRRGPSSSRL